MNRNAEFMRRAYSALAFGTLCFFSACGGQTQTTETVKKDVISALTWDLVPVPGVVQSMLDDLSQQGVQIIGKQCGRSEGPGFQGQHMISLAPSFVVLVQISLDDVDKANRAGFALASEEELKTTRVVDCAEIGQSIH